MKRVIIAGVSTVALALGGCSMFHSGSSTAAKSGGQSSQQAMQQPAQQPSSSATSTAAKPGTSGQMRTSMASRDDVMQAQQKLQAHGLYKGKVDGILGPKTKQALQAFQQKNGLDRTGNLDQRTLSALENEQATGSGTSAPQSNEPAKAPGATGADQGSATAPTK
jgi:His-Xaa-Ser repeat protein HxsA